MPGKNSYVDQEEVEASYSFYNGAAAAAGETESQHDFTEDEALCELEVDLGRNRGSEVIVLRKNHASGPTSTAAAVEELRQKHPDLTEEETDCLQAYLAAAVPHLLQGAETLSSANASADTSPRLGMTTQGLRPSNAEETWLGSKTVLGPSPVSPTPDEEGVAGPRTNRLDQEEENAESTETFVTRLLQNFWGGKSQNVTPRSAGAATPREGTIRLGPDGRVGGTETGEKQEHAH
eukprot:g10790.t1